MILIDHEIEALARANRMIAPFEPEMLSNCRYNLRAGRAFSPETGDEIMIGETTASGTQSMAWSIAPAETLMIMTQERVNIPTDLMATYAPLNHLAQQGLLLVNASIIEPGYDGPLSCFLVNFSNQTVRICPGEAVAKMCVYRLSGTPSHLAALSLGSNRYAQDISTAAANFPKSFLGIAGMEKRVSDSVTRSLNRSIAWGGGFLAVLVLWASLEPLTSRWMLEKLGVPTTTTSADVLKLRQDLETAKSDLDLARRDSRDKQIADLTAAVKAQAADLDRLKRILAREEGAAGQRAPGSGRDFKTGGSPGVKP